MFRGVFLSYLFVHIFSCANEGKDFVHFKSTCYFTSSRIVNTDGLRKIVLPAFTEGAEPEEVRIWMRLILRNPDIKVIEFEQ